MAGKQLKPKKRPVIPPAERPLRGKQEAFCKWYVSAECNFNGVDAARRAGYKGNERTLAAIASENLTKPNIARHIDELTQEALSGANITVEKVLRDLEVTRVQALAGDNFAAAARCSELQGKYLKMFVDRIEQVQGVDEISDEQLSGLIHELAGKAKELGFNVDLGAAITGDGPENSAVSVPAGTKTTH